MKNIIEDLKKEYDICRLKGEIYLWQIEIVKNPNDSDAYKNAVKKNLDELRILEGENTPCLFD